MLRKQGDIDKLRQAREAMNLLFPLSPEMWREWAKDEITVSYGVEAFSKVEKLYERGISEYLSVDLWCDYLNFVQEYDASVREYSALGISKTRNLFERAITAVGLHVAQGHRIWELYRAFEQAIYIALSETDSEGKEKQIQHIRRLFHRQLSIPLADIKSTLVAYKAWEEDHGSPNDNNNVIPAYDKALKMLNDRAHLEENISKKNVDSEKLQEFMSYLKFEHSSGDPTRIQVLYERAISEFPVSTDVWLDYTQYLDKTFKTARIVRDAYYRATRNCPWVGELWVRYLLSLERSRAPDEELSHVFEKSLQCTFSSYDEYLNVFLTRVDGLRRRLSASTSEDGVDYAVIRDTFQRASDYLSSHLNADSLLGLHSYWAQLELKFGNDLTAARGVWENLLKIRGSMLEVWQSYITWEIQRGKINDARSLYKRSYSKRFPGTGSEDICHAWVRFEREYGSLEDYDIAVQKVAPRLQELQLFRMQQENKDIGPATYTRENPPKKSAREKRKPTSNPVEEQAPAKRRKNMAQNLGTIIENDKGQAKNSTEANESAELDENKAERASSQEINDKSAKKSGQFDDNCTAFISNLSLQATATDLHNFFSDVGGVVDVRVLKDKFTKKSRGLAYVEFSDDAHFAAAVSKNKQIFLGKKLSILKSDPQGRKKGVAGPSIRSEQGDSSKQINKDNDVQLKGKNTFAVPRNVKPLGTRPVERPNEHEDPKSKGK